MIPPSNLPTPSARRQTLFWLLGAAALYLILFVFPNFTGARDAAMLGVFEVDEYAQYPHLIRMLTPGPTAYQTLRNFTVYLHYFYGYPFYFFSALLVLPLRLLAGAGWEQWTPWTVLLLREGISVLPMLAAILLWVYLQTRFRSRVQALALLLFLLAIPALVVNNLWWHPDSLVFLFLTLTFFFLDRDDLRFGRSFWLAAAACGLAIGTKHLGVFFVLAIPLYIAWGAVQRRMNWKRALVLAAGFVAVMLAAVVIANPLLLLPQERAEIIATQRLQFQQTTTGFWVASSGAYFAQGYPADFRQYYGELALVLIALAAVVLRLLRGERRVLSMLILAWLVPYVGYFGFLAATRRTHYFLPAMIPLLSSLAVLWPHGELPERDTARRQMIAIGRWALALACLVQLGMYVRTDMGLYTAQLRREQTSPSLAFARRVMEGPLARIPAGEKLVIYRDWHAYLPARSGWQVEMDWNLATPELLRELDPDMLLLERANVALFTESKPALDADATRAWAALYGAAAGDQLAGYHLLDQDSFGLLLVKEDLYQRYFQ